jgi:hypothetical protein
MATAAQVKRIVDILNSEDYDSPEQMARAILKEASSIIGETDSWGAITRIPVNNQFPFEVWGPFPDKTQAKKLTTVFEGAVAFIKMRGTISLDDRERLVAPKSNDKSCETCDHPQFAHLNGTKTMDGCRVPGCTCKMTYGVYKR